jgi:hypothetical protein
MKKLLIIMICLIPMIVYGANSSNDCVVSGASISGCVTTVCTWVADDTDASIPTATVYGGCVWKVITDPGTPAPTDNYDIKLLDSYSQDVLESNLLDRDTSNTETVRLNPCLPFDGTATLTITDNSVNSATGVVEFLICR